MIEWEYVIQFLAIVFTVLAIVYHSPQLLTVAMILTFVLFVIIPMIYIDEYEDDEYEEDDDRGE